MWFVECTSADKFPGIIEFKSNIGNTENRYRFCVQVCYLHAKPGVINHRAYRKANIANVLVWRVLRCGATRHVWDMEINGTQNLIVVINMAGIRMIPKFGCGVLL